MQSQLGILIDKIQKKDKEPVLVSNLRLDSVAEAKIKKQQEVRKKAQAKMDPRKAKIDRLVREYFKQDEQSKLEDDRHLVGFRPPII